MPRETLKTLFEDLLIAARTRRHPDKPESTGPVYLINIEHLEITIPCAPDPPSQPPSLVSQPT